MFKPFFHEPSKQVFTDGAVYYNNPINVADNECKLLWPNLRYDTPDIVVSLGTMYKPSYILAKDTKKSSTDGAGAIPHGKPFSKNATDHLVSAMDSEKTWESYLAIVHPLSTHESRYVRLNPRLYGELARPDQLESLRDLQSFARAQFTRDPRIQEVAKQLIASTFYFEKTQSYKETTPGGLVQFSGMVSLSR